MNGLLLLAIAAALLLTAYLVYGRYLVKTWGINPKAKTPAYEKEDGVDYVPSNKWEVFGHQFSSIAGAGPVTGPVLAMVFGWLPAFLWVMVGGIFFGAVQDFGALYASVKSHGKSMGQIIETYIGKTGRKLFFLFCWLFTLLVIAAFADMVAGSLNGYNAAGAQSLPSGAASSITILYVFVAIAFGFFLKKTGLSGWKQAVLGIALIVVMLALGIAFPVYFSKQTWVYLVFVYIFFASVTPIWVLKQPRDYLTTFLFIGMIVAAKAKELRDKRIARMNEVHNEDSEKFDKLVSGSDDKDMMDTVDSSVEESILQDAETTDNGSIDIQSEE